MKVHEKAKQLSISAKELTEFLASQGVVVKSPNQNLSEEEQEVANTYEKDTDEVLPNALIVEIQDNNTVQFSKRTEGLVDLIERKAFPSKHQMHAYIEYMLSKAEMGDFNDKIIN